MSVTAEGSIRQCKLGTFQRLLLAIRIKAKRLTNILTRPCLASDVTSCHPRQPHLLTQLCLKHTQNFNLSSPHSCPSFSLGCVLLQATHTSDSSFSQHWLSIYYVLSTGESVRNKTNSCPNPLGV